MLNRGWFGTSLKLASLVVLVGGASSAAMAESFYLKNGKVIHGTVINGTLNTLFLKSTDSVVQPVSINVIERVVFALKDGTELYGQPISWKDGALKIRSGGDMLHVAEGEIVDREPTSPDTKIAATPSEDTVAEEPVLEEAAAKEAAPDVARESIVMHSLPSFFLELDETVTGKILHATGSILTIKPENSTPIPISRAQVISTAFESEDGTLVSGELLDWQDGVYHLQQGDRELLAELPDGVTNAPDASLLALAEQPVAVVAEEPVEEAADDPAKAAVVTSEIEQADAAVVPEEVVEEIVEEGTNELPFDVDADIDVDASAAPDSEPTEENVLATLATDDTKIFDDVKAFDDTKIFDDAKAFDDAMKSGAEESATLPVADLANGQHQLKTLVEAVSEDGKSAIFKFELDKPADRPLVILYAVTEASAKAGEDFEAKSGVITFSTGSSQAEMQVAIIDDELGEDAEDFNLFLSGDPESVAFDERQIVVTINDND